MVLKETTYDLAPQSGFLNVEAIESDEGNPRDASSWFLIIGCDLKEIPNLSQGIDKKSRNIG